MLRFLVYFRYGMAFHGPRIGDHAESETKAFDRLMMAQPKATTPAPPKPAL
jgi:hypothetical protein